MSDLDQLRVSLDEALRTISPVPAPVDAAVRRGKTIRARRRLTALAGVVAVAAAGLAGYPAMTHKQPAAPVPLPALTHHHRPAANVTDVPPGPGAAPGTIAEGQVYGESWRVFTGKPGTDGLPSAPKGQQCFGASGPAIGPGPAPVMQCYPLPDPTAAMPVSFVAFSCGGPADGAIGTVRGDVRYVVVALSDGTRLKLTPVSVNGRRYIAFAGPRTLTVDSARAYLDNGQYLTAIPFDKPGNLLVLGMWQRQGQPVPPRITRTISAEPAGKAWWATAYAGPWGTCLTDTFDANMVCIPASTPLGTQILLVASSNPRSVFGTAAENVSYLRITRTNGTPLRVRPVAVGNQKFFAFLLGIGQSIKRWTAYDAAGNPIASGTAPASQ
jgi:hypothetical protein